MIIRVKTPDVIYVDYDPEADSAYIKLREGKVNKTREYEGLKNASNIMLDLDAKGNLLGIEMLCLSAVKKKPTQKKILNNLSKRYHAPALRHINTNAIAGLYG